MFDGNDQVATVFLDSIRTFVFHIEHLGHRRTEDISIEQSYLVAQTCQCDGEVGRDRALADATLTRADGNDILNTWEHLSDLRTGGGFIFSIYRYFHIFSTMVFDSCLSGLDGRFQEGIGIAWEGQYHLYLPGFTIFLWRSHRRGVSHHLTLNKVFLRAGIRHRSQRLHYHLRV